MANTIHASVGDYIASQPADLRPLLRKVRASVRKGLPGAVETISYQIPAYKLNGKVVLYFAGWKKHFSIYPATGGLLDALASELAPYKVSKGTIRFPIGDGVPARLIEQIAQFRAREAAGAQVSGTDSRSRPRSTRAKRGR